MDGIFNDSYESSLVNRDIAPADRMMSQNVSDYFWVGESTIKLLRAMRLVNSERKLPARILDFGSGHGRVARHFRVWAPDAVVYTADIRPDANEFCANTLNCIPISLTSKFGETELPKDIDLIWVGSVFTHIDYERMQVLFEWLWRSVRRGGYLVITTHGEFARDVVDSGRMRFISTEKWDKIVKDFHAFGVGYESYGIEELGDWGVSLISINKVTELATPFSDAKFILMFSGGWANLQDALIWQKM